jgi:DNA primase
MRYGEGLLEEILRRTDLVQLVGRRVKLGRKGQVFWGLCPFHKEKSPSFKVENERRHYHCFGCGAGGDAFKWLTETEGLSFPEAVEKLAGEAGVELPKWSAEDEARESRKKSLYEIIDLAAQFFEDQLHKTRAGAEARNYLNSRGLESEACKRYRLGYAPDGNSQLKDHLIAKGVPLADMIEAGLTRAADENRPARDFFYDRVMFPIADVRGRIVAFGGRGLTPDAKPKYINTGETPLFSKGHLLYNFKAAREAALRGAALIVAEGYMDVIALAEAGFAGAVAPLGTALTEDQLQLLWKVSPEPILSFDGDEAGLRAAKRASFLALPHLEPGHSLRFVFLPKGEDPDSFVRSQGAEAMRGLLGKAQSLSDTLWTGETEGKDFSTPERRAGLEAELDGIVKRIRDGKIADYYRRDFNDRVFKAFKQRNAASPPYRGQPQNKKNRDRGRFQQGSRAASGPSQEAVSAAVKRSLIVVNALSGAKHKKEAQLLGLLMSSPELIERYSEALAWLTFDDPQLDRIRRELLNLAASGKRLDKPAVENHLVRQGLGVLSERLKTHSVLTSDLKGQADEQAREALWLKTKAQLADPDFSGVGDLKARRDEALQRYLNGGSEADWDELQRLNSEIRATVENGGKRDAT